MAVDNTQVSGHERYRGSLMLVLGSQSWYDVKNAKKERPQALETRLCILEISHSAQLRVRDSKNGGSSEEFPENTLRKNKTTTHSTKR